MNNKMRHKAKAGWRFFVSEKLIKIKKVGYKNFQVFYEKNTKIVEKEDESFH